MGLYLNCFFISLIGLGLSVLAVIFNLKKKAKLANIFFDLKLYWKSDLWIQVAGTMLTCGLFLMLLNPFLKQYPQFADNVFVILIFFSAVGYFGSDIASRLFSVVNTRINTAIDYKTTQADTANGTLDAPTPAMKPIDKPKS